MATQFRINYGDGSMDLPNALDHLVEALRKEGVDCELQWDDADHDGFDLLTVSVKGLTEIELVGACPRCQGEVKWKDQVGRFDPKTMTPPICEPCGIMKGDTDYNHYPASLKAHTCTCEPSRLCRNCQMVDANASVPTLRKYNNDR